MRVTVPSGDEAQVRKGEFTDCPRAKTWMTPCVARDGQLASADDGVCVGCGEHPANLLKDLVRRYIDLKGAGR